MCDRSKLLILVAGERIYCVDADGSSAMDCTDYPFDSRYRFSADLTSLVCADCTNCVAQMPCD